jgi:F420-0:gamma-glutamyl ligase
MANPIEKLKGLKERIDLHETYVAVFTTPEGQKVLRHILKAGNCAQSNFVQGDPHGTSFREGQRHLALSIAKMVYRDTTELIKLVEQGLTDE